MIVLVQANVLTVGLDGKVEKILKELPIRVIGMHTGSEAARAIKNEKVDSVVSKWDLDDMKDGRFLKRLKIIKPDLPTIVFVKAGDPKQEIAARSLGVSVVLTDNTTDEVFKATVSKLLGLKDIVSIKSISLAKAKKNSLDQVRKK